MHGRGLSVGLTEINLPCCNSLDFVSKVLLLLLCHVLPFDLSSFALLYSTSSLSFVDASGWFAVLGTSRWRQGIGRKHGDRGI